MAKRTIYWLPVHQDLQKYVPKKHNKTLDECLRYLYIVQNLSLSDIAGLTKHASMSALRTQMLKAKIKMKRKGKPDNTTWYLTEEDYNTLSIKEIMVKYNCSPSTAIKKREIYREQANLPHPRKGTTPQRIHSLGRSDTSEGSSPPGPEKSLS